MTEQVGGVLLAPASNEQKCSVSWCEIEHGPKEPGEERRPHGRVFASRTLPGDREMVIAGGWTEALTKWRATANAGCINRHGTPWLRIGIMNSPTERGPFAELDLHDMEVIAEFMRLSSGDMWLPDTLTLAARQMREGLPEGWDR